MDYKDKTDEELVEESGRARSIDSAPVEMMRRLKNAIEKLDQNTGRYSRKMVDLTILLFIVTLIQIIISLGVISATYREWIFLSILVLYIIYFVIRRLPTENSKN